MPTTFTFLALLLLAPIVALRGASLDIVRDGKVLNIVHPEPGHAYANRNGAVEVRDPRKVFALDAKLGAEFTVKVRMRIDNAKMSASAVVFDERDLFLFGGSAGKMLFQSARFKGVKLDRPAPQVVLEGSMFDLEITRSATAFTIRIDGESIVEVKEKVPLWLAGLPRIMRIAFSATRDYATRANTEKKAIKGESPPFIAPDFRVQWRALVPGFYERPLK